MTETTLDGQVNEAVAQGKFPPYEVEKQPGGSVRIRTNSSTWSVRRFPGATDQILARIAHRDDQSGRVDLYTLGIAGQRIGVEVGSLPAGVNQEQFLDLAQPVSGEISFQPINRDYTRPGQPGHNEGANWNRVLDEITSYGGTGSVKRDLEKPFSNAGLPGFRDTLNSVRAARSYG